MSEGKLLITGGAGFIGSNLAAYHLRRGSAVTIYDNLSRSGTADNLAWLKSLDGDRLEVVIADIRDFDRLRAAVAGARVVYHLAAQVAVTTSVTDPRLDFEINCLGTFNVVEAVRQAASHPVLVYSSTNKVYGGMEQVAVVKQGQRYGYRDYPQGISEESPLDFHSPYGCSKGAGDQYVRDYARIYDLPAVVFRQSCIYGPRQFGNEDQGWVAHFIISAVLGRPLTIYGDGCQVRDVLHVDDLVAAFETAVGRIDKAAGQVYNTGGGADNTMSLLELLAHLETKLGRKVDVAYDRWRPGDQKVYVSDIGKLKRGLGWKPQVSAAQGIDHLYAWVIANRKLFEAR